ncbi:hypothetical protein STIAU_7680 [Stigmatella aurantiaca DW4/3-1]|uniref:Uncharacterized protein n=1 Tax=Stigmatella aurantiaca (strain DW4/3-1) TaxID=378806 RepID=Q08R94_STIAD|nr:hypothetical protein STIAU_7680 [Stigmatella aurantiaca DW4/3-1]
MRLAPIQPGQRIHPVHGHAREPRTPPALEFPLRPEGHERGQDQIGERCFLQPRQPRHRPRPRRAPRQPLQCREQHRWFQFQHRRATCRRQLQKDKHGREREPLRRHNHGLGHVGSRGDIASQFAPKGLADGLERLLAHPRDLGTLPQDDMCPGQPARSQPEQLGDPRRRGRRRGHERFPEKGLKKTSGWLPGSAVPRTRPAREPLVPQQGTPLARETGSGGTAEVFGRALAATLQAPPASARATAPRNPSSPRTPAPPAPAFRPRKGPRENPGALLPGRPRALPAHRATPVPALFPAPAPPRRIGTRAASQAAGGQGLPGASGPHPDSGRFGWPRQPSGGLRVCASHVWHPWTFSKGSRQLPRRARRHHRPSRGRGQGRSPRGPCLVRPQAEREDHQRHREPRDHSPQCHQQRPEPQGLCAAHRRHLPPRGGLVHQERNGFRRQSLHASGNERLKPVLGLPKPVRLSRRGPQQGRGLGSRWCVSWGARAAAPSGAHGPPGPLPSPESVFSMPRSRTRVRQSCSSIGVREQRPPLPKTSQPVSATGLGRPSSARMRTAADAWASSTSMDQEGFLPASGTLRASSPRSKRTVCNSLAWRSSRPCWMRSRHAVAPTTSRSPRQRGRRRDMASTPHTWV